MNDDITIIEIVLWALRHQRDEVGDYLDLSDDELQNLLDRCLVAQGHESIHRDITDGFMAKRLAEEEKWRVARERAMDDAMAKRRELQAQVSVEIPALGAVLVAEKAEGQPEWFARPNPPEDASGLEGKLPKALLEPPDRRALQARVAGLEDEDEDELLQDLERLRRMFDE
jgi:hypothetical protein